MEVMRFIIVRIVVDIETSRAELFTTNNIHSLVSISMQAS
jgi:hypothetical protein